MSTAQGNTVQVAESQSAGKYRLALFACVLLHLALAVWFHWGRSFIGDEWGSYAALSRPYNELLTDFGGWATMNFYLAGLKLIHDAFGGEHWLLVLPSVLCSAAMVLLAARLVRLLRGSQRMRLAAAFLIATSPYLIWYSVTIRSYAVLAACTMAMTVYLLAWRNTGRWIDGWRCGAFAGLALLAHLNAAYSIAAAGALAIAWSAQRKQWRSALTVLIPLLLLAGLAAAAHLPMLDGIRQFRNQWSGDAFIWPTYLPAVAARYFGAWPIWLVAAGLFLAAVAYAFLRRTDARWLTLLIVAPAIGLFLARVSHAPAAYARFLIASVPLLFVIMAMAIPSRPVLAAGLIALFTLCNLAHLDRLRANAASVPFREIAAAVHGRNADRVVMLGASVHRFGMSQVGITLDDSLLATIAALPPDDAVSITAIDGFGATEPLEAQQLGSQRVATFTGLPREIANGLADLMLQRLNVQPNWAMQRELAAELLPVLQWLGRDEDANRVRPIAEMQTPDSRIR